MIKRVVDIVLSLFFILITSPLLILISLFIKFESKGSIIYRQVRVGLLNKDFTIYKFRTMYVDSDKKGLLTIGGKDPRVTRVGYYLRKYKLDELPQFFNVFFGSMSLVGPRPEVREFVSLYNQKQQQVLTVKPGITDYASIEYSSENELLARSENPKATYIQEIMPIKLDLNLKYIQEKNILIDFKIIGLTIRKIILGH